jgi:predicted nucleic acid-binding protein
VNRYFVDAVHLIALANPNDQWHEEALQAAIKTSKDYLVTTEDVLIELLNFYAESGEFMRKKVADLTRSITMLSRMV